MTTFDNIVVYSTVFGVSGIVLFALGKLVRDAANSQRPAVHKAAFLINVALWAWPILAIIYSRTIGLTLPKLVPTLVIPWLVGAWVMFSSTGSDILRKIPVSKLISLSCYRVAGAVFLYCYYCCGTLSRGFALNAGWGDIMTGILAIPTAMMVQRNARYSLLAFALWTVIGIGDLILAPASAAIYGAMQLTDFPINLIPLFLGPPFGILLHLITVRAYRLQSAANADAA